MRPVCRPCGDVLTPTVLGGSTPIFNLHSAPGVVPAHAPGTRDRVAVALVDDETSMLELLRDILTRSDGFFCSAAYVNAREALFQITETNTALVVLDIRMPGICGIECARSLRIQCPRLKIVVLTGLVPDADLVVSIETPVL